MSTTIETLTAEQCEDLARAAGQAGDLTMAEMAQAAARTLRLEEDLNGSNKGAVLACLAVIQDAEDAGVQP
jgi:hypothetical protein